MRVYRRRRWGQEWSREDSERVPRGSRVSTPPCIECTRPSHCCRSRQSSHLRSACMARNSPPSSHTPARSSHILHSSLLRSSPPPPPQCNNSRICCCEGCPLCMHCSWGTDSASLARGRIPSTMPPACCTPCTLPTYSSCYSMSLCSYCILALPSPIRTIHTAALVSISISSLSFNSYYNYTTYSN